MVISNKESTFKHRVSRGSRFNQIYIPSEMNKLFEVGDVVEVRLLEKKHKLTYSNNLPELGEFKEGIINQVFSFINKFKDVKQVFFIGSFLTNKKDYNDIDIIIVGDEPKIDKIIENSLIEMIPLKFHVISFHEDEFEKLLEIDPLIRSMLSSFVSDKEFKMAEKTKIDANHIDFLLMMPQDVLKINLESRSFYDSLRRLSAIEIFLKKKEDDYRKIEVQLKKALGEELYFNIRNNKIISSFEKVKIRRILLSKIKLIEEIKENE